MTIIYVNGNNSNSKADGKSWGSAYSNLTDALKNAQSGDCLWVEAGTYKPTNTTDRSATFEVDKSVNLFGGFTGNETDLSQRDISKNITVLSGDIGQTNDNSDNSYHVVTVDKNGTGANIDGFTIRDGNAIPGKNSTSGNTGETPPTNITPDIVFQQKGEGAGGGILSFQAAAVVSNCTFTNNQAIKGGASYNMTLDKPPSVPDPSNPSAPPTPGAKPEFINCDFNNNTATERGGAMANDMFTNTVVLSSTFTNNSTKDGKGGAIYNDFSSSPYILNSLFTGNSAKGGGAIASDGGSSPVIEHSTITNNKANDYGAALYQGSGPANNPVIKNSIITNNKSDSGANEIYNFHNDTPVIENSIVQDEPLSNSNGKGYTAGDKNYTAANLSNIVSKYSQPAQQPQTPPLPPPPPMQTVESSSKRIVYVDASSKGNTNGASWGSAYSDLSLAIKDASKDNAQIWIAKGTYKPDESAGRDSTFNLSPNMEIYGGFAGGETDLAQRDIKKNQTILSGDIGKAGDNSDNSYHVITGAQKAVVDGITIKDGNANGTGSKGQGGGMINYDASRPQDNPNNPFTSGYSVKVSNVTFLNNSAKDGGAVYDYDRSSNKFSNCTFDGNKADNGGAVLDRVGVESNFDNCTFTNNSSTYQGGATYFDYGSKATITSSTFDGNKAGSDGGAIYSTTRASQVGDTVVKVNDSSFTNNSANGTTAKGGAAYFNDESVVNLTNNLFSNNKANTKNQDVAQTLSKVSDVYNTYAKDSVTVTNADKTISKTYTSEDKAIWTNNYDPNGKLLTTNSVAVNGLKASSNYYEDGKTVKTTYYTGPDGAKTIKSFNNDGSLAFTSTYTPDGKLTGYTTYAKDGSEASDGYYPDGKTLKISYYTAKDGTKRIKTYNPDGTIKDIGYYNASGKLIG
ncbi:MAG: hypothetical protein WCK67_13085 [bacterium]